MRVSKISHSPRNVFGAYAFAAAFVLSLAGCSHNSLVEVTGDVTLGDEPVETGIIGFWPADGQGPSAATSITGGKFQVQVWPGAKKVTVQALKKTGEHRLSASSPPVPIHKLISHERYGSEKETDLRCEISPTANLHSFRLKSS